MELSLPISAAPEAAARRSSPSLGAGAPSVKLPLAFILTGLLSLLVGIGWIIQRPEMLSTYHYNQFVIAATHLMVLGWICSVVMGALYQLVPVALETRLFSEKLARVHYAFHVVGFVGMVWMFKAWNMKQVGHFGCVLFVGVVLFVYNLARTLLRVLRWNVTATAVAAALVWLSFTVIAGLSIAAGKCTYESTEGLATAGGVRPVVAALRSVGAFMSRFDPLSAMHAHAHLGTIGCFTMLIVGVSYKLIPMFTLSEVQNKSRAIASVLLLNVGLAGSFVTILRRSPWKFSFALVMVTALLLYGVELLAILRARKRRVLDWGLKSFLTAVAGLQLLSLLALVLSWPGLALNPLIGQLENLYGFLGLVGVISFAIIGMLYKIIPFLVWFASYRRQIGRGPVPALAELYSERLQIAGYFSFLAGILVTSGGIVMAHATVVRLGGGILFLSVATLVVNVGWMLKHLVRPELRPFPSSSSTRVAASAKIS